jgi:hypothetical protein
MTEEWQIIVCMREICAAVNAARRGEIKHLEFGDGDLRFLANDLLDYREARAIIDAKGYNETGRTLAKVVQLLPDKTKEPKRKGPCGECSGSAGIYMGGGFHRLAVGHYKIRVSDGGYELFREMPET